MQEGETMVERTTSPQRGRSYDAIVVGAGNGGLGAAAQLAAKGVKVLLLEQHNVPGGFATSFVRGRFEFEGAMHLIADLGSPTNKGSVRIFLEDELGIHLDWFELPEAFRLILTDPGQALDVIMRYGRDDWIADLEQAVPGSRQIVTDYVDLCLEVVDALTYLGESRGNPDRKVLTSKYANFLKTAPYTVDQVANAMKVPKRVRDVFHALWTYLGVSTDRMSFTVFGGMMGKLIPFSGWIPRNRSHEFTSALEARIRELGGETQFNTRVEQILVEEGRVVGVVTSKGERIATKHVVANASPTLVYNRLIQPQSAVPDVAYRETQAHVNGVAGFTVYLGLDASPQELGLKEYSYLIYANMDTPALYETFKTLDTPKAQASACLNNAIPDCSPPGTSILSITTLFRPDAWKAVRPEDYVAVKNRIASGLIADFEQATGAPLRQHIEEVEVATPLTYARYTGAHGGTIYGYEPEPWDSLIPRMMALTAEKHIQGLEFCGGYTFRCHGYSSSFMSGQTAGLLTLQSLMQERG
jgi:phytoene dehydrogenase-like protein